MQRGHLRSVGSTGTDSGALVDTRTCSGALTALVFADGKEVGSEMALKQIYNRRAFACGELHEFLTRDILGPHSLSGDLLEVFPHFRYARTVYNVLTNIVRKP